MHRLKNTHPINYQITKQAYDAILATAKNSAKKKNGVDYVADFINEQYDLRGTVTQISII